MARRLRPLGLKDLDNLPCACQGCVYWESPELLEVRCGASCDPDRLKQWYGDAIGEWGEVGRVAAEDDEVLGFIKYAPAELLPQSRHFPGTLPDDAVLLACVHIRDDARQHGLGRLLLQAALRDLVLRGERTVYAYAAEGRGNVTYRPLVGVEFLIRHGFTVMTPHPNYPLLKLDLRSLATITENLEAVLQSLRIPVRRPQGVPSPSIKSRG